MKGIEILKTYPKVAAIIKEWFTKKMIESMSDNIPEDYRNYMMQRGATDEYLVNVIDKNPAALFEIFDSKNVYVGIVVETLPETEKSVFRYYICPKGKCLETSSEEFFKRKDVEHYAMLAAIDYINKMDEE
ncbi:MAG: hypothetical protein WC479_07845 [Candidatus Izemoplasmatales bacterium]|jgi:hypothetical protein